MKTLATRALRRMIVLGAPLLLLPSVGAAQPATRDSATSAYMQSVLDRWQTMATQQLRVGTSSLTWIIFYDGTSAWHVNADTMRLPKPHSVVATLRFGGRAYPVYRVDNGGALWVPDRDKVPLRPRAVTMLHDNGRTPFSILPLPGLYRQLASPDQAEALDQVFAGLAMHELTHTRHLAGFARRVDSLRGQFKLPEDLGDNVIEERFALDTAYAPLFGRERDALINAVFAENTSDARASLREALDLADERRHFFFADHNAGYAELDDLFLVLEGTGMWAQFKTEAGAAPSDQQARRTIEVMLRRTRAWSQQEGFLLFLLLDRFSPGWQSRFMTDGFPSPFVVLRDVVR